MVNRHTAPWQGADERGSGVVTVRHATQRQPNPNKQQATKTDRLRGADEAQATVRLVWISAKLRSRVRGDQALSTPMVTPRATRMRSGQRGGGGRPGHCHPLRLGCQAGRRPYRVRDALHQLDGDAANRLAAASTPNTMTMPRRSRCWRPTPPAMSDSGPMVVCVVNLDI